MKKLICMAFALIMALSLTACGGGGGTSNNGSADVTPGHVNINLDRNVEADISILIPGGNSNEETMIRALIDDFALLYPRVNIEINYVTITSYESTIRNLSRSDMLDDIIWSNSPDFYFLTANNLVYNLNPYVEASEAAGVFNLKEDFYSEYFDMGRFNDMLFCVPRSADSVVTFINTDIFSKAGITQEEIAGYQQNGWDWNQLLDVCARIRKYFDEHGQGSAYVLDANLVGWLSVNYPMLLSYGVDVVDANGNISFDKAKVKECLELVRYMVEQRYIVDSQVASGSSFETGTSAMLFQSSSVSHYADRKALENKVDLIPFPLIKTRNNPKIGCGIAGYCINKNTKYADVCWAFLNYMLTREGQQAMADNGLNLAPIRKDLATADDANWKKNYPNVNMQAYLFGSEYKTSTDFLSRITTSAKTDFEQAIIDMFASACNQSKSIDDAIDRCLEDMNDALDV